MFRRVGQGAIASLTLILAGQLIGAWHALAEPLDKDACGKLQVEKQAMLVLGVDKEFAKGPEWARNNLGQPELNLIKRYLTVEEQLKFRCGVALVNLTIPDDADDGDDTESAASATPSTVRRAPVPKPAAKPAKAEPAGVKPAAPAAKPAPKPAAPKAQSWNTQTAPADDGPAATGAVSSPASPAPATGAQPQKSPRPEPSRPAAKGEQG